MLQNTTYYKYEKYELFLFVLSVFFFAMMINAATTAVAATLTILAFFNRRYNNDCGDNNAA